MKRTGLILALIPALSGCFGLGFGGNDCAEPRPYQKSRLTEPVKAPEGLDELDPRRNLDVPVGSTPPGANDGRCLEEPPPYSERLAESRETVED